ncbi:MAG: hypothetical protein HXL35_10220 [Prevotellaceae bacterium]|nr:hypothetical protein [Prevotellaceae bacterium]
MFIAAASLSISITGCGTSKQTTATKQQAQQQSVPQEINPAVAANADVLSIKDAALLLNNPEKADSIARANGYTVINRYGVYRVETYAKMLYKNCTPAKSVGKNLYDDTPKPRRKGTSSYVAMMPDGAESIIIGVFNTATYQNLVEQVKTAGFKLDMPGDEDAYTNGRYNIYCYSGRKTVRIEKVR